MIIYRQNNRGAFAGNHTFLWMLQPFLHPIISVTSETAVPTVLPVIIRPRRTVKPDRLRRPRQAQPSYRPPVITATTVLRNRRHLLPARTRRMHVPAPPQEQRHTFDMRGRYRVFNDAEVRFFRTLARADIREGLNGPAPDAWLDSVNPDIPPVDDGKLRVGWVSGLPDVITRAVIELPTILIPAGATVKSAWLRLYCTTAAPSAQPARIRRVTRNDWDESTVTWNSYKPANSWTTPGGDYTETDEVSFAAPTQTGYFYIPGLLGLVQDAVALRSNELHLILMRAAESTPDAAFRFASGEHGTLRQRPTLIIECQMPKDSDTPFATDAALPHQPATAFADARWAVAASFFNGVLDSGFFPLGKGAEQFTRVDVSAGVLAQRPPHAPSWWRLESNSGGVVRVVAEYFQDDILRATEWAITYTTDGTPPGLPPDVSPTVTVAMQQKGPSVIEYALPAQGGGTIVKVRLQARRFDTPDWLYSEDETVLSATADVAGASTPPAGGASARV